MEGDLLHGFAREGGSTQRYLGQVELGPEAAAGVEERPIGELRAREWRQAGKHWGERPEALGHCLD